MYTVWGIVPMRNCQHTGTQLRVAAGRFHPGWWRGHEWAQRVGMLAAAAVSTPLALAHSTVVPAVWPAAAICAVVLLRGGFARVPDAAAIALVSAALMSTTPSLLFARAGFDLAAAVASLLVLSRLRAVPPALDRVAGGVAFIVGVGAVAALAGALFGVVDARLTTVGYGEAAAGWAAGGAAGAFAFAPALLLPGFRRQAARGWRAVEFGALLLATLGFGTAVLTSETSAVGRLPFFPLLAWAALRFRHEGTALFLGAVGVVYLMPWIPASHHLILSLVLLALGLTAVFVGALESEREKAIVEASDARDALQSVLETVVEPFVAFDDDLRLAYANLAAARAHLAAGGRTTEVTGDLLRALSEQSSLFPDATGVMRLDWTSPLNERQYDVGVSKTDGLISLYLRDVTNERRAFDRLALSERRYRELTEASFDLIAECDEEFRLLELNRRGEELTGRPAPDVLGSTLLDLLTPDSAETLRAAVAEIAEGRETAHHEVELVRSDGTTIRLDLTARLTRDESGRRRIQAVGRDVTERFRVTERLHQAQRLEAVGRLAGGIAHDFNNLLLVVSGYAQLLASSLGGTPAAEDVEEIARAAERGRSLVRQLLAFARRQVLNVELVDLNAVVRDTESMVLPLIGEDVELRTSLATSAALVRADRGQLEQIVVNLALNARDAMPDGGVLWIEVDKRSVDGPPAWGECEPGDFVTLVVRDTGPGVPAELRDQIFEPFFSTKTSETNSGLGLPTVYGIVSQLRGGIDLVSEPGAGAAFTIYLPSAEGVAAPPEATHDPARSKAAPAADVGTRRGTVLVVEDEEGPRRLVKRVLEDLGHRTLSTSSPLEALELVRSSPGTVDVLVTDIVMPEMSGPELVRRLEQIQPLTPVIYTTGYSERAIELRGKLGGIALLEKPFEPAELGRIVNDALMRGDRKEVRR